MNEEEDKEARISAVPNGSGILRCLKSYVEIKYNEIKCGYEKNEWGQIAGYR